MKSITAGRKEQGTKEPLTLKEMEGDSGGVVLYCLRCGADDESSDNDNDSGNDRIQRIFQTNVISHKISRKNKSSKDGQRQFKYCHVISNSLENFRKSSAMMSMLVLAITLLLCGGSDSVTVSAVDLNPHGGFYQREGGKDFFSHPQQNNHPHQHQQSIFGNGGIGGADFSEDDGMSDMIMTCSRPVKSSRAAKYLAIKQLDIPCDMGDKKSAWCNLPGDKYPWHAVRRFVFENQGLMRRMYGEVRQLSLLRMEFDDDDLDDEIEDERHGPPKAPPIPEDHRRNSILTEVLDESLPRVLSETPPEDQILLRDHHSHSHGHGIIRGRERASTPRTLSSTPSFPSSSTPGLQLSSGGTTTSATVTTTPVMTSPSSSSEEMFLLFNGNGTDVMMGVTVDSLSAGGMADSNMTTTPTAGGDNTESSTSSTPGITITTTNSPVARNGLTEQDFIVTEEATQATAGTGVTETENDESEATVVTTTEEMPSSSSLLLAEQTVATVTGAAAVTTEFQDGGAEEVLGGTGGGVGDSGMQQQLNDGLLMDPTGSIGSDESHDFLNLDKNHILYFDDVGKNRRPSAGANGNGNVAGEYVPSPSQSQPSPAQSQQGQGKLKAVNACPVKEEVVAPYWANNTRGEILALLNLYPFEQYIHWERCNHENKQMFCRQGCRCEQQYRLHRLLAFDPTNECRGIFSDWFRFPSCCVCRCYLNEYELMMLNAAGQDPPPNSNGAQSRTSDRIRSPRKLLLEQLVDGPDVQGVDDIHFFYKQGFNHEHNHGAQPRRKRASLFNNKMP